MHVFVDQVKKDFQVANLRARLIGMPFEVGTHPTRSPDATHLYVCGLGNGLLIVSPGLPRHRSYLEKNDTLPFQAEREIELSTHTWHRSPPIDELPDQLLVNLMPLFEGK